MKRDDDSLEKYFEKLDAWLEDEDAGSSPLGLLAERGVEVRPSAATPDEQLHDELWHLIRSLAGIGFFLHSTDHISDRELYELLENVIQEPALLIPENLAYAYHYDLLGGCSNEDIEIQHRYYDDDEDRARWMQDFPDYSMPPREPKPYDRDRFLPDPMERQRQAIAPDA